MSNEVRVSKKKELTGIKLQYYSAARLQNNVVLYNCYFWQNRINKESFD